MDIISDGLTDLAVQHNVEENYDQPVSLFTWSSNINIDPENRALVLDLDLSSYSGNSDSISVLNKGSGELREVIQSLKRWVPQYLERGGTVVVLLSNRVQIGGWNPMDNYGWLDNLQSVRVHQHAPRERLRVVSGFTGIENYFNFVDYSEFGILLNERIITSPEVLAVHSLDYETIAVSINEYADPNGVRREVPGSLVVLPKPTHPERDFFGLLDSLFAISGHTFNDRTGMTDNRLTQEDIQEVIDRGETEKIELKEQFPDSAQKVAKEAIALANNKGGVIIFGITDDCNVVGLDDASRARERVNGVIRDKVDPMMDTQSEIHQVEGKEILIIRVPTAKEAPYSKDGVFYIRHETSIRKMTSEELVNRFN